MTTTLIALVVVSGLVVADDLSVPTYIELGDGSSGWGADCFTKFPWLRERFSTAQLEFFCQQVRARSQTLFNDTTVTLDVLRNSNVTQQNGGRLHAGPNRLDRQLDAEFECGRGQRWIESINQSINQNRLI